MPAACETKRAMPAPVSDLQAVIEPQERLDRLISVSFRRFGRSLVDLSYANPYDPPSERVLGALGAAVGESRERAFQYTPYGGNPVTRRVVAASLTGDYGLPFTYRDVVMTPGAMAALNITFRALFGHEDEVIVLPPCWQDYPLYLGNLEIPYRFVPLAEDKHLDLDAIEANLSRRTRGLLFSHPACPTGVVYSQQEIEALSGLLSEAERAFSTAIYLVCDEVHRRMVWNRVPFHSPLLSWPRALTVYSFGKTLSLQGQRIGYVAVSPRMAEREQVRTLLERCTRVMGFCTPTSVMQHAICRLVDHEPPLDALAERQQSVRAELKRYGYEVCEADATFFVYLKSPIADAYRFAEILASFGVLVIPSPLFHERGHLRLSLTARYETIMSGLSAFARALEVA